ncbi:MAG: DUF6320 domain-containing protein [Acholeplasmataceae bacterium]
MKYCKTCRISYDTPLEHCLFCGQGLTDDGVETNYSFTPHAKHRGLKHFNRIFIFVNAISALIALFLDYRTGLPLTWSLIVAISNLYAIALFLILYVKSFWTTKLTKAIMVTVVLIGFIGLSIRDYGWALDYVFPLGITANILLLTVLLLINRKRWYDYSVHLFSLCLLGLIPALFDLLNVLDTRWPSIVCYLTGITTLLGMFLLSSEESKEEFRRRFHI